MTDSNVDANMPLLFGSSHILTRSDKRTSMQKRVSVWLILVAVGFERLAFYSLVSNLVLFLTSNSIRWTSLNSITASFIFYGKTIHHYYLILFIFDFFEKVPVMYQQSFSHGSVMQS